MNTSDPPQDRPQPVSLRQAFWYWLKLGFISFGGPAGQIAIMHHDLVEKKRWIYLAFGHVPAVAGVLYGIKPAVTAIVLFAAYRIGSRALKNWLLWSMAGLAFFAIFVLDAPFPLIVIGSAIMGAIGGKLAPQKFAVGGGHGAAKQSYGPALIDDDTPTPAHARFTWTGLSKVILAGLILWGGAIGFLCARYGWDGALTQMGWFFTKAALLTFGGAYAVLPYVYQGAVVHFHWLTPHQMIDALALGETTPGPLIMVVTFVGFVAGWGGRKFLAPINCFWQVRQRQRW